MKIIDRYIGMSVIATAFFGVVVLSLVLVLGNLFKQLLDVLINNPDVPIATVLAFMALVLPFSLTFTIPWGFLTALLLVFGRISADNELIALKSNGVSVPRICIPVFVLAVVLSGICFWINIDVAPRAEQQMTKTIVDIATSNPAALFRADEVVDQFPDRRVYVGSKEGDRLKNLIVFELNENSEPIKMVYAKEGVLTSRSGKYPAVVEIIQRPLRGTRQTGSSRVNEDPAGDRGDRGRISNFPRGILQGVSERSQA